MNWLKGLGSALSAAAVAFLAFVAVNQVHASNRIRYCSSIFVPFIRKVVNCMVVHEYMPC